MGKTNAVLSPCSFTISEKCSPTVCSNNGGYIVAKNIVSSHLPRKGKNDEDERQLSPPMDRGHSSASTDLFSLTGYEAFLFQSSLFACLQISSTHTFDTKSLLVFARKWVG